MRRSPTVLAISALTSSVGSALSQRPRTLEAPQESGPASVGSAVGAGSPLAIGAGVVDWLSGEAPGVDPAALLVLAAGSGGVSLGAQAAIASGAAKARANRRLGILLRPTPD